MAKLLIENINNFEVLTESRNGKKEYYIEGVFMEANRKNRNGRVYPKNVMEPAVDKYITEKVKTRRALGTLGHENSPVISEKLVSHLITELAWDGDDVRGKARILDTIHGKEVQALIDGGVSFGVSSRAIGSIKEVNGANEVQSDFQLSCIDIVLDPSAHTAWVESVMESSNEWEFIDGEWKQKIRETIRKTPNVHLESVGLKLFKEYLDSFRTK